MPALDTPVKPGHKPCPGSADGLAHHGRDPSPAP
jgi:hypothetical protein